MEGGGKTLGYITMLKKKKRKEKLYPQNIKKLIEEKKKENPLHAVNLQTLRISLREKAPDVNINPVWVLGP